MTYLLVFIPLGIAVSAVSQRAVRNWALDDTSRAGAATLLSLALFASGTTALTNASPAEAVLGGAIFATTLLLTVNRPGGEDRPLPVGPGLGPLARDPQSTRHD